VEEAKPEDESSDEIAKPDESGEIVKPES